MSGLLGRPISAPNLAPNRSGAVRPWNISDECFADCNDRQGLYLSSPIGQDLPLVSAWPRGPPVAPAGPPLPPLTPPTQFRSLAPRPTAPGSLPPAPGSARSRKNILTTDQSDAGSAGYKMTSFYGSSCANNGKGVLNTPEREARVYSPDGPMGITHLLELGLCAVGICLRSDHAGYVQSLAGMTRSDVSVVLLHYCTVLYFTVLHCTSMYLLRLLPLEALLEL
eukprot:1195881-Prorocentrum_minimum.AAC.3